MKLFIGTKEIDQPTALRFFNILEIDDHTLTPRELRAYQTDSETWSGNMRNWGFAWHGDHLYAPNRTRGLVQYDRDLNVLATWPCPVSRGPTWKPESSLPADAQFDRPHQIACLEDRIFICDSGHNLLRVFDPRTQTQQSIGFDARRNWINSVNLIDGAIHLVFHNHGWSDLVTLDTDLRPRHEKNRIGVCAHHVWTMQGERWTCSSQEGKLRSVDSGRVIELGGYPRGVAIAGRWLIIGISRTRRSTSLQPGLPSPMTSGARPLVSSSGLVFLDRDTLTVGGTIEFQKLANDAGYLMPFVFEVRLMEARDEALGSNGTLSFGNIDKHLHLQRTFSPSATGPFSGR